MPQQFGRKAANQFLEILYPDVSPLYFMLWSLRDRASGWFQAKTPALKWARTAVDHHADVYCSVGLSAEDLGKKQRVTNTHAAGVVGVVADVDFAGKGKKNYPPEDVALEIATSLLAPSVLVYSGNGLQAWWLYREIWTFDDEDERAEALELSRQWGGLLQDVAKAQGYKIDSVHDLARVMRLPGTWNLKDPDEPKLVQLTMPERETRYNPNDLREIIDTRQPAITPQAPQPTPALPDLKNVATDEHFPWDKHEALLQVSPEYKGAWDRTRDDIDDTSPSGWDMSLANTCAKAGIPDQEIAAVLVASRRRHNDGLKRPDYYSRTVAKASVQRAASDDEGNTEPETREERLETLNVALGITLTNIQRITGDTPIYRFVLEVEDEEGNVEVRAAEIAATKLLSQMTFRGEMFALTDEVVSKLGPKAKPTWDDFVYLIGQVAEEVAVGEDGTSAGDLKAMVDEYLNAEPPQVYKEREMIQEDSRAFVKDGLVWFKVSHLLKFASTQMGLRLERQKLVGRLCVAGATRKTMGVAGQKGSKQTTGSFYGLPWDHQAERPAWR